MTTTTPVPTPDSIWGKIGKVIAWPFVWVFKKILQPLYRKILVPIGRFLKSNWLWVAIVVVIVAAIICVMIFWVVPAFDKALMPKTDAPAATEVVATQSPAISELQALLPEDAPALPEMVKCGQSGVKGMWDSSLVPSYGGTKLVCADTGYWEITNLVYGGVEYPIPGVSDVAAEVKDTPVPTEAPTEEATPAPTEEPVVDPITEVYSYVPPEGSAPLLTAEIGGSVKGFAYYVTTEGPYEIKYPYQSTVLIALGNGRADYFKSGTGSSVIMTSDGTIGNILADNCREQTPEGCSITITGYTPGHVGVTVVFGGYEVPDETLVAAVNNMLKSAPNCGANACKTVKVNYFGANQPVNLSFTNAITPTDVAGVLLDNVLPYANVAIDDYLNMIGRSQVVLDDTDKPVGLMFYLANEVSYISVPEAGGDVIFCGSKATVNDIECPAGSVMVLKGNPTDGSTPKDLNKTITVESSDPAMIRVIQLNTDFENQLKELKIKYPDSNWLTK